MLAGNLTRSLRLQHILAPTASAAFSTLNALRSEQIMASSPESSPRPACAWKDYQVAFHAGEIPVQVPKEAPTSFETIAEEYDPANIGNTPLVEISGLTSNPDVKIMLKCEFENPGKSIKDRIALHILTEAENNGKLLPGGTVVAASSGNTGAAIALLCKHKGYEAKVITSAKCSKEKVDALRTFGADTIVAPSGVPADHPDHYQNVELQLCKDNPSWFGVNQYDNLLNPDAYFRTLGPEIYEGTDGQVTHLFAAASTGGTVSGIGKYLKKMNPNIQIVCPDPIGSIFYEYYTSGKIVEPTSFQVEGVGKDSIPGAMNFNLIDQMPQHHDKDAFAMCRFIYENTGLLVGGSAGLNLLAAAEMADAMEQDGTEKIFVCIGPDSGEKYLSKIFNESWLRSKKLA